MNVVDSSAWLEYFADGPNADFFAPAIEAADKLVVPSICVYEVFKRVLQQRGEAAAMQAIAQLRSGRIIPLDDSLAVTAASLGHETKLALADSVVLATARLCGATLWTQDAHFDGMAGVQFRRKA